MNKQILTVTLVALSLNLTVGGAFLLPKDDQDEAMNEFDFPPSADSPLRSASILAASAPVDLSPELIPILDSDTIVSSSLPGALARKDIIRYEVELGDTVSSIAARFGVSSDSLVWSNHLASPEKIFPGQEITIPPVSGVIHKVAKNDTVSGIAARYGAVTSEVIAFNGIEGEKIAIGEVLVVPNGKVTNRVKVRNQGSIRPLPRLTGYFINPTTGVITQGLHPHNAIDIANKCGITPILAAAKGKVTIAKSSGYNGGAGKYIKMAHPNGTDTLYAHLDSISVSLGQVVEQGQVIGIMGNTGRVRGPTGCHLHFSVYGASNPLAG